MGGTTEKTLEEIAKEVETISTPTEIPDVKSRTEIIGTETHEGEKPEKTEVP